MSTAKHTPGPWRVITRDSKSKPDRFGRTTEKREVFINGSDGLGSIAKLYIGHEKDARLLAAGPELKDALNGLYGLLQLFAHRDDVPPEVKNFAANHRAIDALAVLAKVES